jgi:hypothetical protein
MHADTATYQLHHYSMHADTATYQPHHYSMHADTATYQLHHYRTQLLLPLVLFNYAVYACSHCNLPTTSL